MWKVTDVEFALTTRLPWSRSLPERFVLPPTTVVALDASEVPPCVLGVRDSPTASCSDIPVVLMVLLPMVEFNTSACVVVSKVALMPSEAVLLIAFCKSTIVLPAPGFPVPMVKVFDPPRGLPMVIEPVIVSVSPMLPLVPIDADANDIPAAGVPAVLVEVALKTSLRPAPPAVMVLA